MSDIEPALLENLFTSLVMNHGEEVATYFPTKLSVPEVSVEATSVLNPQVSVLCEDGKQASICKIDYDHVNSLNEDLCLFDFLLGSDLTYSGELGLSVARTCFSLLKDLGEAVVVSPEERAGNVHFLVEVMKRGRILSTSFVYHHRRMTSPEIAEECLGRKPRTCVRPHLIIHFSKYSSKQALGGT